MSTSTAAPEAPTSADQERPTRRRRFTLGGAIALLVAIAAIAWIGTVGDSENSRVNANAAPPATAVVERGPLSAQVYQSGTLGYAARADGTPYEVVNQARGAYTKLPEAGDAIGCGDVLYRVADQPVVLLCGSIPAYRELSIGDSGPDVRQLNRNLIDLGYAKRSELERSSDEFNDETAEGLVNLQADRGLSETGTLSIDQAVFLPGSLRVTKVNATPATMARPSTTIAQATTTKRRVEVDLDASQASGVDVGDKAQVTLPDTTSTTGKVTHVGMVAAGSQNRPCGTRTCWAPSRRATRRRSAR